LTSPPIPAALAGRVHDEVVPLLAARHRQIAIIGAGDAAFDYALNLARHNQVLILNRGVETRCLPLLKERVAANSQITYYDQVTVQQVLSDQAGGLQLLCESPKGAISHHVDDLIAAIGRQPCDQLLTGTLEYPKSQLTQSGFLHIIGDVRNGLYRQTAIAAGEGVRAAMQISDQIKANR
jgi:thioredoxin reductase